MRLIEAAPKGTGAIPVVPALTLAQRWHAEFRRVYRVSHHRAQAEQALSYVLGRKVRLTADGGIVMTGPLATASLSETEFARAVSVLGDLPKVTDYRGR
jgi:hypothetical protein